MIAEPEALSGGDSERIAEILEQSAEFETNYTGINDRFNELLEEAINGEMAVEFIDRWGRIHPNSFDFRNKRCAFPQAFVFSKYYGLLVELDDGEWPRDNRRRRIKVFPGVQQGQNYLVTLPRVEDPVRLNWIVSSEGAQPRCARSNIETSLGRALLCKAMFSPDLKIVPYTSVNLPRK